MRARFDSGFVLARRGSRIVWVALVTLAVLPNLLVARAWPELPQRFATHFNGQGAASGWMQKSEFAMFTLGISFGMLVLFAGLSLAIGRMPTTLINMPRRAHWLAAKQRERSLLSLQTALRALGLFPLVTIALVTQTTIQASLSPSAPLTPAKAAALMVVTLSGVAGLLVWLYSRYIRSDH